MSDTLDEAAALEERERSFAQTIRKPEGPLATGRCLFCDELVADELRWCDALCRDAWQADMARAGRPRPRA